VAKKVFISYRREDTANAAGRVYDRLCQLLPKSGVFLDVDTIRGGIDFEKEVVSAIEKSDAVLVFIGKKWLVPSLEADKPRIWEPGDYVRAEVRAALGRPIVVLPVLVDGAQMSKADLLPEDVSAITKRNALPLRHESFDDDTEKIVAAVFGVSAKERPWDNKGRLAVRIGYAVGGAVIACVLLVLGALAHRWLLARPLSASIGEAATTLLLIVGAILGAWLGLRYEAGRRRRRLQA
jgi:hypothetical protein